MNLGDMVDCFESSYDSREYDHEYDQHSWPKVGGLPPRYAVFSLLRLR